MSTESDHVISLMDVDGATAFVRAFDIAVMEFPLWALYPELDIHDDANRKESNQIEVYSPCSRSRRPTHQPT